MIMKMSDPLLPSFSNSRTYTYESDDVGAEDVSSAADSSMASESLASLAEISVAAGTTASPGAAASPGTGSGCGGGGNGLSPGGYSAKSARFKSAMTNRARQRRMRRMREREASDTSKDSTNSKDGGAAAPATPGTPNTSASAGGELTPGGFPPLPASATSASTPNNDRASPGSPADRLRDAKDHVALMKGYRRSATDPPSSGGSQAMTPGGASASSSPLHNRLYAAHRSRSMSRSRESPPSTSSGGGCQTHRSPSSPNLSGDYKNSSLNTSLDSSCLNSSINTSLTSSLSGTSMSPAKNKGGAIPGKITPTKIPKSSTNTPRGASINHLSAGRETPVNSNSAKRQPPAASARSSHQQSPPATIAVSSEQRQRPFTPDVAFQGPAPPPKPSGSRRSKRDKHAASQPRPEEFLPDWKASGDPAALSPEEVRDAANFTSIQFQCSGLSGEGGEVEMFSDEVPMDELADGDVGSVFSGFSGFSGKGGFPSIAEAASEGSNGGGEKQSWQNEVWVNNSGAWTSGGSGNVPGGGRTTPRPGGAGAGADGGHSEATTPSIFHRGEIFHRKAAASIVSLLSPDRMFEAGLMAPEIDKEEDEAAKDVEGDSPSGVGELGPGSYRRNLTFDGDADPGAARGGEWKGTKQVNRTLFRDNDVDDLDDDVRRSVIFQAFRQNMMPPSNQLSELLGQIHRRPGTLIDRAYATRRKNACGALKILSAREENRMKICWTVGVLPAIASVLDDVHEGIADDLARAANTEARNRIVSTLLNLGVNKKNRMLIVNTPGVLESMTQCIRYDHGEGRQGCCTVLLYLAKTAEARPMIARSAGMMDVLAKVVEVPQERPRGATPKTRARRTRVALRSMRRAERAVAGAAADHRTVDGTMDRTADTGRCSRRRRGPRNTRGSEEGDSDETTSEGSRSSTRSGGSAGSSKSDGDSRDSGTVESSVASGKEVEQMEISFETADTAEMENLVPPGRAAAAEVGGMAVVAVVGDGGVRGKGDGTKGGGTDGENAYDADPNVFLHGARLSVFACLLCLVKSPDNAFVIAREEVIVEALIGVCNCLSSPSHSRAMSILAHLTRHPKNCHTLVFNYSTLLPMLQGATASPDKEARRYSFCALQNLSMDKSCRAPIAHSPKIIWSLTERCKMGLVSRGGNSGGKKKLAAPAAQGDDNEDEARLAAMATLQNLSDEPANLIQFTIVKDCVGTIIQIAREDVVQGEKTDLTSFMAKNTLVTLSHWFRKIATSGSERMGGMGLGGMACNLHRGSGRNSPAIDGTGGHGQQGGGAEALPRTQVYLYNARLEPTVYDQWS